MFHTCYKASGKIDYSVFISSIILFIQEKFPPFNLLVT